MISKKDSSDVQYAVVNAAVAGDNAVLPGTAGVKFRVISCLLVASGNVAVRFESGPGGTAMTGQMQLGTNTGFALNENMSGWFETGNGEGLSLELSGATSIQGCLSYVEILPGQAGN